MKKYVVAVDVGNTSALFCLCREFQILKTVRIPTNKLSKKSIRTISKKMDLKRVEAFVIASVVPQATRLLKQNIPQVLGKKVYVAGQDLKVPIRNCYKKPNQVGMDRLMNAVAVHSKYKKDAIVIDFGTAITFDVISRKGEYLGGVIAPGIEISLEALFQKTALLPKIRLKAPRDVLGRDTTESIRIGCAYGIGGLCDRLTQRLKARFSSRAMVLATGGYARFMRRYCESFKRIDSDLVIRGILRTYYYNYPV